MLVLVTHRQLRDRDGDGGIPVQSWLVLRAGQTVAATQRWRAETWLENREITHKSGRR